MTAETALFNPDTTESDAGYIVRIGNRRYATQDCSEELPEGCDAGLILYERAEWEAATSAELLAYRRESDGLWFTYSARTPNSQIMLANGLTEYAVRLVDTGLSAYEKWS